MRDMDFYLEACLQGKIYALHRKGLKALKCWRECFSGFFLITFIRQISWICVQEIIRDFCDFSVRLSFLGFC